MVMELNSSDQVTDKYIRGSQLIKSDINGYYLYNAHGDVIQLTDPQGTITTSYLYDAFGIEQSQQINDPNPFRYCGEYFDSSSGTYYLRNRYYDSVIGRFTQEDTYRGNPNDPLSLNLYTYSKNNPIFYIDPSGHDPVPVWTQNINSGKGTEADYEKAYEVYEKGTASAWASSARRAVDKAIESTLVYYAKSSSQNNRRPNTGEPGSTYTAPNGDKRIYGPDGRKKM